jgi:hypothetical protein
LQRDAGSAKALNHAELHKIEKGQRWGAVNFG